MSKAKEDHIIPEHLINVPLAPERELEMLAKIEALKMFILDSISDEKDNKEVRERLKMMEKTCLKRIKQEIAQKVRSKDFESRFSTQTSEKEENGTKSAVLN